MNNPRQVANAQEPWGVKGLVKLAAAAVLYAALAKFSRFFLPEQQFFCILWLPAGLGLAQVLLGGNRYTAGVFLGALFAHLTSHDLSVLMAVVFAAAAALEAYAGTWLLKRNNGFDPALSLLVDFQRLIVLAGITATLLATLAGSAILLLLNEITMAAYPQSLARWWMGDLLGIVLLTPFILVWKSMPLRFFSAKDNQRFPSMPLWKRPPATGEGSHGPLLEAILVLGVAFLVGQAIFLDWFHATLGSYAKGYFMYLFVVLAALRLGKHGTFAVLLMVAVQGILSANLGVGYFARDIAESGLVNYWLYMIILSMVGITLASYITAEQQDKEALREQGQFFRMITDNIDDLVAVLDLQGRRLYNSPSYGKLFGDPQNLLYTDSFAEVHPDDRDHVRKVFMETVNTSIGQRIEFRFILPDQSVHFMESRGGVICNTKGELMHIVVVSHDITERRQAEETIRNMAYYDALTQLPNRRMLQDRLALAMAASKRSGRYGALMMLDLDNFKPLNDKHGHAVGDLLLVEVARRIICCVREVDTVARLGGDEFVVVLSGLEADRLKSLHQAASVAEKIRETLAEPYLLRAGLGDDPAALIDHRSSSSIGLVTFLSHDAPQEDLLARADKAMYRAKQGGRDSVYFDEG